MAVTSEIMNLAMLVMKHTKEIDDYVTSQGLPTPSFGIDAPLQGSLSGDASKSRELVLGAIEDLHALIAGPLPHLMQLLSPARNVWISLQAITEFAIAEHLGTQEEVTFFDLARRVGLLEADTRRLLRLAIASHIFQEPRKGFIAHNATSRAIAESSHIRQWIQVVTREMWPSSTRTIDALREWPLSEEPQHTGFALANGNTGGFFDVMGRDAARAQRFSDTMQFLQSSPPFHFAHLIENLRWNDIERTQTLVDVGGSRGSVSIEILRRFPQARCIVQDLGEIISDVKAPKGLEDRLTFMEHNFFLPQPVVEGDVYLLRYVLHDWSDKYAVQILRNLIPALRPGNRIVLNEICIPEPGEVSRHQEQVMRGYDLAMKQTFNGKERDIDDWNLLFAMADPHFKLVRVETPMNSILSVIELRWEI